MTVLIDTPIWSLALRRAQGLKPQEEALKRELAELVREGQARLTGPIRQEILSGIRDETQFRRLRGQLRAFPDDPLTTEDYEEAARAHNRCRRAGVAGSAIDFLICATAARREWAIFTTDSDFERYAKQLSIRLHSPRPDFERIP
jgi:predicted nucleic acid-binding protein